VRWNAKPPSTVARLRARLRDAVEFSLEIVEVGLTELLRVFLSRLDGDGSYPPAFTTVALDDRPDDFKGRWTNAAILDFRLSAVALGCGGSLAHAVGHVHAVVNMALREHLVPFSPRPTSLIATERVVWMAGSEEQPSLGRRSAVAARVIQQCHAEGKTGEEPGLVVDDFDLVMG
jgi:hypothetical protein